MVEATISPFSVLIVGAAGTMRSSRRSNFKRSGVGRRWVREVRRVNRPNISATSKGGKGFHRARQCAPCVTGKSRVALFTGHFSSRKNESFGATLCVARRRNFDFLCFRREGLFPQIGVRIDEMNV